MELFNRIARYFTQERNKAYTLAGAVGGSIFSARLLTTHVGVWSFMNGEAIVKSAIAIVLAGITGFATKMGADLWSEHIKPKIKFLNNGKQKDEDERRA